jgi:hypothetical protein
VWGNPYLYGIESPLSGPGPVVNTSDFMILVIKHRDPVRLLQQLHGIVCENERDALRLGFLGALASSHPPKSDTMTPSLPLCWI